MLSCNLVRRAFPLKVGGWLSWGVKGFLILSLCLDNLTSFAGLFLPPFPITEDSRGKKSNEEVKQTVKWVHILHILSHTSTRIFKVRSTKKFSFII